MTPLILNQAAGTYLGGVARGLSEEELDEIEVRLRALRRAIAAGDFFEAERILQSPALDGAAMSALINEVRRLRTLLSDIAPHFTDHGQAPALGNKRAHELRQLQVRLSAEVDRPPR